ncbi:hypothetical protein BDR07DRAFT_1433056 [Suillus spraguei]|nr:hypothetical protein BDR07DRAFT_1433056 [Suillus spraguei]
MHHSLLAVISALTALTFMSVSATPAVFSRDDQCLPFESKCSTDPGAQPCCQPFQCVTLLADTPPPGVTLPVVCDTPNPPKPSQ